MGLLFYIYQNFWKWPPLFSMTVCAWQLVFFVFETPTANLFWNISIYLLWPMFFKLLEQTVCFKHLHAKQNKTKNQTAIIWAAAVCTVTLSNKYHIPSVHWSVKVVTDLIIHAALNGCYSHWVKRKLAASCTDAVPGNVLHRSDWYVTSFALYLVVITCSVM